MHLWLVIAALLLAGLLLWFEAGTALFMNLPPEVITAAVAGLLLLLYAAAARTFGVGDNGRGSGISLGLAAALLALSAAIAARKLDLGEMLAKVQQEPSFGSPVTASGLKSVRVRKNEQGVFLARGAINGLPTDFIVDTGASAVLLKASDAASAGIATEGLAFSVPISTSNGAALAAAVRLRTLSVGPLSLDNVEALVAKPGSLNENLLGMSFLTRLRSYELSGNFMTLRQ